MGFYTRRNNKSKYSDSATTRSDDDDDDCVLFASRKFCFTRFLIVCVLLSLGRELHYIMASFRITQIRIVQSIDIFDDPIDIMAITTTNNDATTTTAKDQSTAKASSSITAVSSQPYQPQRTTKTSTNQTNGRTLGFLQDLCYIEDYERNYAAPSCWFAPHDLTPLIPRYSEERSIYHQFAPYLATQEAFCNDGNNTNNEDNTKCNLHFNDFINDEYNGISWCPNGYTNVRNGGGLGDLRSPCEIHHRIAIFNYVYCMMTKWNITYFVESGALIGAMRHGGVELTDRDIDIGTIITTEEGMERFQMMMKDASNTVKQSSQYQHLLETTNTTIAIFENPKAFGHGKFKTYMSEEENLVVGSVDIFWVNYTEDGNGKRLTTPSFRFKPGNWEYDWLLPLRECNLMGKVVPCPHRPHTHLKNAWRKNIKLNQSGYFFPMKNASSVYRKKKIVGEFRNSSLKSMSCLQNLGFSTLRLQLRGKQFKPIGNDSL